MRALEVGTKLPICARITIVHLADIRGLSGHVGPGNDQQTVLAEIEQRVTGHGFLEG